MIAPGTNAAEFSLARARLKIPAVRRPREALPSVAVAAITGQPHIERRAP